MYFPQDMNFQYFFFSTYPGYFLQALPFALTAGIIYIVYQKKGKRQSSIGKMILPSLFVCYMTGLLCLTLFQSIISDIYYYLFYHRPSGNELYWFTFEYDFIPDFYYHFNSENIANIFLFFPFGILYPIFRRSSTGKQTIAAGIAVSILIELLQPIFGRSFDTNDIILNGLGVAVSTAFFCLFQAVWKQKR